MENLENIIGRLDNFKFDSAAEYLAKDDKSEEANAIRALSLCFGNCGWFWGSVGDVAGYAVKSLCDKLDPEKKYHD